MTLYLFGRHHHAMAHEWSTCFRRAMFLSIFLLSSLVISQPITATPCKDTSRQPFTDRDFPAELPDSMQSLLVEVPEESRADIAKLCTADPQYTAAMERMEFVIAGLALKEASVLREARSLNHRILNMLERTTEATATARLGAPQHASKLRKINNSLLAHFYGNCDRFTPGCVGDDPQVIRKAFQYGNVREQLFLSWNPTFGVLHEILACDEPQCACGPYFEAGLAALGSSTPSDALLRRLCLEDNADPRYLGRGRFAHANSFFRKERPLGSTRAFRIDELLAPFSVREQRYLQAEDAFVGEEAIVTFNSGAEIFEPVLPEELNALHPRFPDPKNLYYETAERFGFPILVAMSGSTDSLLTLGCVTGANSRAQMERLRMAAIAYMVPLRHHTIYEILVASKSYPAVDLNPTPDYYKEVFSSQPDFAAKVETMFRHKGYALPLEAYARCVHDHS